MINAFSKKTERKQDTSCHAYIHTETVENDAYTWLKTYSSQRQGSVSGLVIGVGN